MNSVAHQLKRFKSPIDSGKRHCYGSHPEIGLSHNNLITSVNAGELCYWAFDNARTPYYITPDSQGSGNLNVQGRVYKINHHRPMVDFRRSRVHGKRG